MHRRSFGRNGLLFAALLLVAIPQTGARTCLADQAAKLHVLIVADTNASQRGGKDSVMRPGMTANLENLRNVISEVYSNDEEDFKGRIFLDVLEGNNVTIANIRKHYTRHPGTSSDNLLFYYCGHGAWDSKKGHYFATSDGDMLRSEVFEMMNELRPRGLFMISDCCSSYADFSPPPRNRPAKWKVFRNLFFESSGLVSFTAARESQFGWINSVDGGFFTKALTNYLCQTSDNIRTDGELGYVSWDDFFRKVRDTTSSFFDKAKDDAPSGSAIKDSADQTPYAFSLGSWPVQHRRLLIVKNDTNAPICVWLQYWDVDFGSAEWKWYYPTNPTKFYEIAPGASTTLNDNGSKIGAYQMHIWANSLDGRLNWLRDKTEIVKLSGEDGYRGPYSTYTYTFR